MKKTATAPANIAFIKYWGKIHDALRIPANSSISMNLSGTTTTTTVEFSQAHAHDSVVLADGIFSEQEVNRIISHLDRIRRIAQSTLCAKIVTSNTFPKGTGIASSASGFAALTVAAAAALGLSLSGKELTVLARIGSGSACRSIPDGFVEWKTGGTSEESYAYSLYPSTHWDLCDVLAIVEKRSKEVTSTDGMDKATTSPFWKKRFLDVPNRLQQVRDAMQSKDIRLLGEAIEADCLSMHAVMMTQVPSLFYWNQGTMKCIECVGDLRTQGIPVYFTIDAGPNVHCICEANNAMRVADALKACSGVQSVLLNKPSAGTVLTDTHLF